MDAWILLIIGTCPFPLLRANEEGLPHLEHDLGELGRVLCHDQGPIEAATQAMADMLSRPWSHANDWIDAAVETDSLPLLHRVMIALSTVKHLNIPSLSGWAETAIAERLRPAIAVAIQASGH